MLQHPYADELAQHQQDGQQQLLLDEFMAQYVAVLESYEEELTGLVMVSGHGEWSRSVGMVKDH